MNSYTILGNLRRKKPRALGFKGEQEFQPRLPDIDMWKIMRRALKAWLLRIPEGNTPEFENQRPRH